MNKDHTWGHDLDELDRRIAVFLQEDGILSLVGVVNPIKVGLNVQTYVQVAVAPISFSF